VGGVVRHSQRTAGHPEGLKNARRLASMTAMRALGFEPDLGLWASPGFEPRAVPLEGVLGVGSVFVDARTVGGDIKKTLAGLGVPCASVEVKRGRRDEIARAHAVFFTVSVLMFTARRLSIDLPGGAAATVLDLKHAIEEADGVPVDQQRLIYAGKQLEDGRPLSAYGIEHEATVHCLIRISGC
jgi:ubiquitin-large subunit ribosomal protein L40e